uniref:Uncharacterized protein n=1 Tax=Leersia perrieri TaxID=77586 RepID=A0A0D9VX34_9ORYZ
MATENRIEDVYRRRTGAARRRSPPGTGGHHARLVGRDERTAKNGKTGATAASIQCRIWHPRAKIRPPRAWICGLRRWCVASASASSAVRRPWRRGSAKELQRAVPSP